MTGTVQTPPTKRKSVPGNMTHVEIMTMLKKKTASFASTESEHYKYSFKDTWGEEKASIIVLLYSKFNKLSDNH